MAYKQVKPYWWLAVVFTVFWGGIFAVRYHFPGLVSSNVADLDPNRVSALAGKDSWMNIYLNNQKIGYSHGAITPKHNGFELSEKVFMRMNIMGFSQDVSMETRAQLKSDLSLETFDFHFNSGMFELSAAGRVTDDLRLNLHADFGAGPQPMQVSLKQPIYLTSALWHAVFLQSNGAVGDQLVFDIFDPSTMSQEKAVVHVSGKEDIHHQGVLRPTTKLTLNYKGATAIAWVDESGDILREEGILGMALEKTTQADAFANLPVHPQADITRLASIEADQIIENPRQTVFLKIRLTGIDAARFGLHQGRQTLHGDVLEIVQEKITPRRFLNLGILPKEARNFLKSEPFIESDHPKIIQTLKAIVSAEDRPDTKAKKIIQWIQDNIRQKPVLSIPDALATLENKVGDCNEHAVLVAALARAAGIPAKIEAGLVYLDGRFYYHAWNLLYVGQWVTADAVFGQMPADATHIRFVSGSPKDQLDLMPVMDKVGISILDFKVKDQRGHSN